MQALQQKAMTRIGATMTVHSPIHAALSLLIILSAASFDVCRSTAMTRGPAAPDSGRMFDEYGTLPLKKENERLDNLAFQLSKEPQSNSKLSLKKL
jgi:hypothetical protein